MFIGSYPSLTHIKKALRLVHTTLQICCDLQWTVAFLQGDNNFSISCDTPQSTAISQ